MNITEAHRVVKEYMSKEGHNVRQFIHQSQQRKFWFVGAKLWKFIVATDHGEFGLVVSEITRQVVYCTPIREEIKGLNKG